MMWHEKPLVSTALNHCKEFKTLASFARDRTDGTEQEAVVARAIAALSGCIVVGYGNPGYEEDTLQPTFEEEP